MDLEQKRLIAKNFEEGEKNKGIKMLATLMLKIMASECIIDHINQDHPHLKHCLHYILEISQVINTMSTNKIKKSQVLLLPELEIEEK